VVQPNQGENEMRRIILTCVTALLFAGVLTGCQSQEQIQQRQALDGALRTTSAQIEYFNLLGSFPNMERIHGTMDKITASWTSVENIAKTLPGTDVSKASAAYKDLADTVNSQSSGDIQDGRVAMESIKPKLATFASAVSDLQQKYGLKEQQ
jgi:hypothetical protein